MSDIFHEVDEEVRREQLQKLWARYGNYAIAAAVLVVTAVTARHRAEAAADLAALAAAGRAVTGSTDPCAAAASIASANGAVLEACTVDAGAVVQLRVGVRVRLTPLGVRWAHANARAGPVEPGA